MKFSPETIQEIKSRLDIVEVASRFVEVKQRGNRWVCLCPFHNETKPSFYLNRELGLYYCFGCQASGDVIDLFCKLKGVDFIEGIKELAEETGITIDHIKEPKTKKPSRKLYLKANLVAHSYFREELKKNQTALNYLRERDITSELIERFEIGFAPDRWEGLKTYLLKRGINEDLAIESGLLSQKKGKTFDRFRNRIIFPIMDVGGDVLGFGGRILGDGEPKYLNTNETLYFKKGHILYGLFQGKKQITSQKEVIITEGYIDLITLFQFGFENSCAVLGTALTEDHIKRLSSFCEKVILVFDGDPAGKKASFRSAEMILAKGMEVKVVVLPEGEDVDSFLKKEGRREFEKLIDMAFDGIDFCIKMIENLSPKNIMGWCVSFLKKIDDFGLKSYYIPKMAQMLNLSERLLRQAVDSASSTIKHFSFGLREARPTDQLPLRDKEFLKFVINYPQFINDLNSENIENAFESELGRSIWKKMVQYGYKNILNHLNDAESSEYIKLAVSPLKVPNPVSVYEELTKRIKEILKSKAKLELKKKIKNAEKNKDFPALKKLLREYQKIS